MMNIRNPISASNMVAKGGDTTFYGKLNIQVIVSSGAMIETLKEAETDPITQAEGIREFTTALSKVLTAAGATEDLHYNLEVVQPHYNAAVVNREPVRLLLQEGAGLVHNLKVQKAETEERYKIYIKSSLEASLWLGSRLPLAAGRTQKQAEFDMIQELKMATLLNLN